MVKVGIMLLSPQKYSAANLNYSLIISSLSFKIVERVRKTCANGTFQPFILGFKGHRIFFYQSQ